MNILVIGHSYVVDSNRQFWNQVAQNKNVKVDIIVPNKWNSNLIKELEFKYNPNTDSDIDNIYPINCFFKGKASIYFFDWIKIYKIFLNKKYDLIFVFQETWSLSVAQISLLKLLSHNKSSLYYLAVCQNIVKTNLSWAIPWEKLITKNVNRILYCTKEILDVLNWKNLTTKTYFFPFTYDQNIYDFKSKKINKEIVIGYMGRLTEEKGLDCLIEACKILIRENFEIKLLLAGSGPLKGQNKESFIEYAGPYKHTEAHLFYHQINLFVLPSETRKFWKEQFGRVLVESVASGTPIVGSTSGAIPEVLANLELDYVFKEGNSQDLARVIKILLSDINKVDFADKMNHANELNLKNFSHLNVGRKLLLLIEEDLRKSSF